ncbi:MAG TPA: LysR family transcriptional regulator [Thermohalobaculum sp.]|nr:LysR family transcriptional regulator [Thermohalobaculum sp.]
MTGHEGAPRLWIKIYFGDRGQIGPGKIRLLECIAEHRSISAAARAMGMSYRRAWVLVDQMNQTFGAPVAAPHTGGSARGGAELTPLGAEIVARYHALMKLAEAGTAEKLGELAALIRPED